MQQTRGGPAQRRPGGWLRALLLVAGIAAAGAAPSAERASESVCGAQLREFVFQRLGQTVRFVDYRWHPYKSFGGNWTLSEALVYVNECPGYHYFQLTGDRYRCEWQYHLGKVPNYLLYRSTGGGC